MFLRKERESDVTWKIQAKERNEITEEIDQRLQLKRHEGTFFSWIKKSLLEKKVSVMGICLSSLLTQGISWWRPWWRRGEKDGLWWWMISFSLFSILNSFPEARRQFYRERKWCLSFQKKADNSLLTLLLLRQKNQLINCHWDMKSEVHWKQHQSRSLSFFFFFSLSSSSSLSSIQLMMNKHNRDKKKKPHNTNLDSRLCLPSKWNTVVMMIKVIEEMSDIDCRWFQKWYTDCCPLTGMWSSDGSLETGEKSGKTV